MRVSKYYWGCSTGWSFSWWFFTGLGKKWEHNWRDELRLQYLVGTQQLPSTSLPLLPFWPLLAQRSYTQLSPWGVRSYRLHPFSYLHFTAEKPEAQQKEITEKGTLGDVEEQPHFLLVQLCIDAREGNICQTSGAFSITDIGVWKLAVSGEGAVPCPGSMPTANATWIGRRSGPPKLT